MHDDYQKHRSVQAAPTGRVSASINGKLTNGGRPPLRLLTLAIAVAILASVFFAVSLSEDSVADASGSCGDGLKYTYTASTKTLAIAKIGEGTGAMTDYNNSSNLAPWRSYESDIQVLTIVSGVTSIGQYAFYYCSHLTGTLTIPNSVTSIGKYAFNGCSGFNGTLTIPDSVTYIGENAFSGCSGFTGNLTIPNSVTYIGDCAFQWCSGFNGTLTIPDSVTSIGSVFNGCSGFTGSLTIPDSVTSIGDYAFRNCSGFNGTLTIPSSVTSIGNNAFIGCSGFTGSLTIGNGVQTIGTSAFEGCSGFNGDLTISSSVKTIRQYAFSGCTGFTGSLTIPSSVTSIAYDAFSGCSSLTSISLPDKTYTVTVKEAFVGLTFHQSGGPLADPSWDQIKNKTWVGSGNGHYFNGTMTVYFNPGEGTVDTPSKTVTYGGTYGELPTPIYSQNFVGWFTQEIGGDRITASTPVMFVDTPQTLYAHWTAESSFTVTGNIIDGSIVEGSVDYHAALNIVITPANPEPPSDPTRYTPMTVEVTMGGTPLVLDSDYTYTMGTGTISIEAGVIAGNIVVTAICPGICGDGVQYIYNSSTHALDIAWRGAGSGDGTMRDYASGAPWDSYKTEIESLNIGDGVTLIGSSAFEGCTGLTGSLTIPNSVISIKENAFKNCYGLTGSLTIGNGVQTIGNSAFQGCSGLTGSLMLPDSVTTIDIYAFQGCSRFGSLTLPNNVSFTAIGDYAFMGCSGFAGTLTIPASVTTIDIYAFNGCSKFTGLTFSGGSGLVTIGSYAFEGCNKMIGPLSIPSTVTTIGNSAFKGCTGFTGALAIPNAVTTLGTSAFNGCTGFNGALTIGNGVTIIGNSAFSGCTGFNALTIPSSVTTISQYAFYGCTGFDGSLSIPGSVSSIEQNAFSGCTGFSGTLTIPDTVLSIGEGAFGSCSGFTNISLPDNSYTPSVSSVFSGLSFYLNGTVLPTPEWDAVMNKSWKGPGNGNGKYYYGTLTVNFDPNGGIVDPVSKSVTYGGTYGDLPVPEPHAYFEGWYTDPSTGDHIISTTSVMLVESPQTLYARWSNYVAVTFHGNGSDSGSMDTQYIGADDFDQHLTTNEFGKTGYSFQNWNTVPGGTGATYANQADMGTYITAPHQTLNLYAQWTINQYTATFNLNGGFVAPVPSGWTEDEGVYSKNFDYGTAASAIISNFGSYSREGYTKEAETTSSDTMGTTGMTITANWSINQYAATFDLNGGSVESAPSGWTSAGSGTYTKNFDYGTSSSDIISDFGTSYTREGHTKGTPTASSASMGTTGMSITANWIEWQLTVTFDKGTGEGSMADQVIMYTDSSHTLAHYTFTKEGYSFTGWKDDSAADYSDQQDVFALITPFSTTLNLTAQWSINQYTATFDLNGGSVESTPSGWTLSGSVYTKNFDYGTAASAIITDFGSYSREGYTKGAETTSSSTMGTSGMTITANWTINQYTATFNLNGGSVASTPSGWTFSDGKYNKDFDYGTAASTIITDFGDYSYAGHTKGTETTSSDTMGTSGMTITANWTEWQLTVSFDSNGGQGTMADQVIMYTAPSHYLADKEFTRGGHTFSGWNTEAGGTGTPYDNQADVSALITSPTSTLNLFAQWDEWQLTVTFDKGTGEGVMADQVIKYTDSSHALAQNTFTKEGYSFNGWKDDSAADYTDMQDVSALIVSTDSTLDLTAQWSINQYAATFDLAGGSMASAPTGWSSAGEGIYTKNFNYGTPSSDIISDFGSSYTRDGHTKGTPTASSASMETTGMTITATWIEWQLTVTFDKGTGEGVMADQVIKYTDSSHALAQNTFTKEGYSFNGWKDDSGTDYTDMQDVSALIVSTDSTLDLTAQWSINKYDAFFDLNGGTVVPVPTDWIAVSGGYRKAFDYGTAASVIITDFGSYSREGYTKAAETVSSETMGTSGMTITANWTPNKYTAVFDLNGGSVASTPTGWTLTNDVYTKDFDFGTASAAIITDFGDYSREGYVKGTESVSSPTVTTSGMTITAQWTPEEYSVTANISGGSIEETTVSYHVEAEIAITAADGHSLPASVTMKMGADDFTEFTYADGVITIDDGVITGPLTITATCPEWQLTVTFDGNGGQGTMADQVIKYSAADKKLTKNTFTKEGYSFTGWKDATGADYTDGQEMTVTSASSTLALTAQWSEGPGPSEITFDSNGGTPTGMKKRTGSDGKLTEFPDDPKRDGYSFDGWYTSATGGTEVTLNTVFEEDSTVYAHWTVVPVIYTVTFDSNGGSPTGMTEVTGTDGKLEQFPSNPSRNGYAFDGWYSSVTGGSKITLDSVFTSDTVVFAHWSKSPSPKPPVIPPHGPVTPEVKNGSVTIPESLVAELGIKDLSKLKLTIDRVKPALSNIPLNAICFDINLRYNGKALTSFSSDIEILLEFTLPLGMDPDRLKVFFISTDGRTVEDMNGHYDPVHKGMRFGSPHLSMFVITDESIEPLPGALSAISIDKAPAKLSYVEGDRFDPQGLVINLEFENGTTQSLAYEGNESKFSFSPSLDIPLKASAKSVTITYEGKSTVQDITVKASSSGGSGDVMVYLIVAIGLILLVVIAVMLLRKRTA